MARNCTFHANLRVLDGKNWERWFRQMKVIFAIHDVYKHDINGVQPLLAKEIKVQGNAHKDLKKKDNKALIPIHHALIRKCLRRLQKLQFYGSLGYFVEELGGDAKVKKVKIHALKRLCGLM